MADKNIGNSAARSYEGRWALITGASSGIGEAFARRLSAQGANLILVARRGERLKSLAGELTHTNTVRVETIAMDLSVEGAATQLWSEIQSRQIKVSILVNNAGFGAYGPLAKARPEVLSKMISLNIQTLTLLTQLALPSMLEATAGEIYNIASIVGFVSMPSMACYAASKAFVLSFSEAVAAECKGTGVKVLAVCPGGTSTEFTQAMGVGDPVLPTQTPMQVVDKAIDAMRKAKKYVICAHWTNGSLTMLPRLFSRATTLDIVSSMSAKLFK